MITNKTYNIKTMKNVCDIITTDNKERLAADIASALCTYIELIEMFRIASPKETEGKSNYEISPFEIKWTDDGENKITGLTVKSKEGNGFKATFK